MAGGSRGSRSPSAGQRSSRAESIFFGAADSGAEAAPPRRRRPPSASYDPPGGPGGGRTIAPGSGAPGPGFGLGPDEPGLGGPDVPGPGPGVPGGGRGGRGPGGTGPGGRGGSGGPGGKGPGRGKGAGASGSGGGTSGGRPAAKRRSLLWRWRRALFLIGLLGLVAVASIATMFARTELPEVDALQQSTFVCDASVGAGDCSSRTSMATIQGGEDRVNVRYEDLPQHLIDAVVAMEDRSFFEHRGINPISIGRALYRDLRGDAVQQGGSTITQQYVKNAFLSPERALSRKIKEAVLSVKLEQVMSKEEILEGYLNTIYFGRGAYGVQAASRAYFGRDLQEIGIAESAYLAGLIRAPNLADGTTDPEEATRRRHTALVAMQEEGYITEEEAAFADAIPFDDPNYYRPLEERSTFETTGAMADVGGDYITAYVNHLLEEEHGLSEEQIFGGGYRVYTSIDPMMQDAAWRAVNEVLNAPEDPVAAMTAIDDQGLIRAMVGGRNFDESEVNHAVRGMGSDGQQVGSTFKPIALAELVQQGASLDTTYPAPSELDIQQEANGCAPTWTVRNYEESDEGTLNVNDATRVSSNTAYGQMMWDLGPENVIQMAHDLGMTGDISPACGPIVLGTELSTPLEMATVYSTFANRGMRNTPSIITRIEQVDQDGNVDVVYEHQPDSHRVLSEAQADIVTEVLQGVITDGTGTAANIDRPAAGKTGTAQANRDAWFVGYTPRMTAAVWMGYTDNSWDDPETTDRVEELRPPMNENGRPVHGRSATGGSFPAEIWGRFMRNVADHFQWNDEFQDVPDDVMRDGEILNTPPPSQGNGPQPPPGGPTTSSPGGPTTSTTPPESTTSSSSSTTSTSFPDTTDPTMTIPTFPPTSGGPPRPGDD
jgi:membrane peptidoglycan carboxypeptidase